MAIPSRTGAVRAFAIGLLLGAPMALGQAAPADLCIITITPSQDFATILVRADLQLTDADKSNLSDAVDVNRDGTITSSEVRRYETESYVMIDSFDALGQKKLVLDWETPERTTLSKELKNVDGPAAARTDWGMTEVRVYRFGGSLLDSHHLEGGLYAYEPGQPAVEFVTIRAPVNWIVSRVNDTAYDARQVDLPKFDTRSHYSVDFQWVEPDVQGRPREAPGPGLVLIGLILAGVVLRRR